MQRVNTDLIQITEVPTSLQFPKIVEEIVTQLRKGKLLKKSPCILAVSCASGADMKRLNKLHRKIAKVTDVLSFEAAHTAKGVQLLGSVVVCLDVARKQAKESKHSLKSECTVLLVHGILHLLGFDHERSKADFKKMMTAEQKILKTFGLKSGLISRNDGI